VALGQRDELTVFGGDYATADGTCVRDYIHVVDVAKAHVAAIAALRPGHEVINLATGTGSTVLEIIDAASHAVGRELPYRIGERRAGDAAVVIADAAHSAERLGWKAERSLQTMCDDHWRWQSTHPDGYPSASLAADRVVSLLPIDLREDDSVTRPANAFDRNVVDTRGA